jgi:serine/threonine protein kinase
MFLKKWLFTKTSPKDDNPTNYNNEFVYIDNDSNVETFCRIDYYIDDYFYPDYNVSHTINIYLDVVLCSSIKTNDITLDDFHIIDIIEKGNYGKLCLSRFKHDNNIYAIKCIKKKKAKIKQKYDKNYLEHPFLLTHFIFFEDEKYYLYAYSNYPNLDFKEYKLFPEDGFKFYFAQIAITIDLLHKMGIVYKILNLKNVLLDSNGFIRMADLAIEENDSYTPPEVIIGESFGKPVDLWCMGVLLYELYHRNVIFFNPASFLC